MLRNESDEESEIPMGQAWKWILHIEDEIEIYLIFENLKKKLADNKLTLANLQIDQLCSSDDFLNLACKSYRDPVVYDEFIPVARIISTHVENDSSEFRYIFKRWTSRYAASQCCPTAEDKYNFHYDIRWKKNQWTSIWPS